MIVGRSGNMTARRGSSTGFGEAQEKFNNHLGLRSAGRVGRIARCLGYWAALCYQAYTVGRTLDSG